MRIALPIWSLSLLLGLAACTNGGDSGAGKPPAQPPLYTRLGGQAVMAGVMDDFMVNAAADPRIARRFRGIDNTRFKAAFGEQLCASLGGPCRHAGPSMKDVHASMGIADAEFNAMTQDLRRALAGRGVSVELQVEVAAAMEPMRDDIVSPIVPADSVVITEMVRRPAAAVAAGKKPVAKKGAAPAKANAKATTAKKEPEPKNPIVRRKWRRPEGA